MLLLEQLARYNLAYIAEVYALDLSNGLEESKLKISKANKGKRLGCAAWNKGKNYLPAIFCYLNISPLLICQVITYRIFFPCNSEIMELLVLSN